MHKISRSKSVPVAVKAPRAHPREERFSSSPAGQELDAALGEIAAKQLQAAVENRTADVVGDGGEIWNMPHFMQDDSRHIPPGMHASRLGVNQAATGACSNFDATPRESMHGYARKKKFYAG